MFIILLRLVRDEGTPVVPVDEGEDSDESDKEVVVEPVIPPPKVAEVTKFNKNKNMTIHSSYRRQIELNQQSVHYLIYQV